MTEHLQVWGLCEKKKKKQLDVFHTFLSFHSMHNNTLIDAKYPHGKIILGIGVEWGGLIGPEANEKKKVLFNKASLKEPIKEQSSFMCMPPCTWCVCVCLCECISLYMFSVSVSAPPRRGGGSSHPPPLPNPSYRHLSHCVITILYFN